MKLFAALCCLCLLCDCISTAVDVDFDVGVILTSVDRSSAALKKFGQAKISQDGYSVQDGLLVASWSFTAQHFMIKLTNKTAKPIRIEWDDASFIDARSNAHRVVKHDVALKNTSLAQAPVSIPPSATSSETLFCPDGVITIPSKGGDVHFIVLPYHDDESTKNIAVMIPFETEGQKEVYTFKFHVLGSKQGKDTAGQQKK